MAGSSVPDTYDDEFNKISLEVKCWNLTFADNVYALAGNIVEQINARITNLPKGTSRRVVIDLRGQVFDNLNTVKVSLEVSIKSGAKTTNYSIEYITD